VSKDIRIVVGYIPIASIANQIMESYSNFSSTANQTAIRKIA
jgi:hypothetical protein